MCTHNAPQSTPSFVTTPVTPYDTIHQDLSIVPVWNLNREANLKFNSEKKISQDHPSRPPPRTRCSTVRAFNVRFLRPPPTVTTTRPRALPCVRVRTPVSALLDRGH